MQHAKVRLREGVISWWIYPPPNSKAKGAGIQDDRKEVLSRPILLRGVE